MRISDVDEVWGERVVAVLESVEGRAPTEEEIGEYCAQQPARYKYPRQVLLCRSCPATRSGRALPRTSSGKMLKRHLRGPIATEVGAHRG